VATLADNNVYIAIDGVAVSAYFRTCTPNRSSESIDVTAGAGVDHMLRAPGLIDTQFSIKITYDDTAVQSYITHIAAGQVVSLEWGPQGASSGKPRHVQNVLITASNMTEFNVDKAMIEFDITCEGAAAPSVDMWSGGVYS
jgi:hypothetical protein